MICHGMGTACNSRSRIVCIESLVRIHLFKGKYLMSSLLCVQNLQQRTHSAPCLFYLAIARLAYALPHRLNSMRQLVPAVQVPFLLNAETRCAISSIETNLPFALREVNNASAQVCFKPFA